MSAPLNAQHIHLGGYEDFGKEMGFVNDLYHPLRNGGFRLVELTARGDQAVSKSLKHNRRLNPSGIFFLAALGFVRKQL